MEVSHGTYLRLFGAVNIRLSEHMAVRNPPQGATGCTVLVMNFYQQDSRIKGKCFNRPWTRDEFPPERLDCVSPSPLGIVGSWEVRMLVLTHWSTHLFILLLGGPGAGVPEPRPSLLC